MLLTLLLQLQRLPDGGMRYAETDLSRFIVEPFNFASSCCFGLLALWWAWRLRGHWRQQRFLTWSVPLLLVGCIGGSVYHGFRAGRVWLVMDFMPIAILLIAAAIYFWTLTLPRKWMAYVAVPLFLLLNVALMAALGPARRALGVNLNYSLMGLMVVVPLAFVVRRFQWEQSRWVGLALGSFAVAVFFRWADGLHPPLMPMGTHWLWHVFGLLAGHFLMQYIWFLGWKQEEAKLVVERV